MEDNKVIKLSVSELKRMLSVQKRIVAENLSGSSSYYNSENTLSTTSSLPIDKVKFLELAMKSNYPDDFLVLEKYLT